MTKTTRSRSTWITRDAKSAGFVDRFTVPGIGEVRVMPSETIDRAKRNAAGLLRKAIANAMAKKTG